MDIVEHIYSFVLASSSDSNKCTGSSAGVCFLQVTDELDRESSEKLLVLSHSCLALVSIDPFAKEFRYETVLSYSMILSAVQTENGRLSLFHGNEVLQLLLRGTGAEKECRKALALIKARRGFHERLVPGLLDLNGLTSLFGDFEVNKNVRSIGNIALERFYEMPLE